MTSAPTPNNYLYCGQQFDPDLGLYYNRARYGNTDTGRFWSRDQTDGNNEDPLSLHKYLYAEDNPVDGSDPSGNDLADVSLAAGLGAGIDALADTAIVGAEVSAETTVEATEVAEVTETAVAEGESTAAAEEEAAETTLEQEGTSVRKLIEQVKKLKNLAKDVKVIPMPQAVIPAICANITAYQAQNPLTGFELTRCGKLQRDRNRTAAEAAYLANPIRGLPSVSQNFDEYPFASSFQGGKGARVTPVPIWQNSLQGGIVSGAYKIEKIKEDTAYTVVVIP
jgi:RHS repeat-associated protein